MLWCSSRLCSLPVNPCALLHSPRASAAVAGVRVGDAVAQVNGEAQATFDAALRALKGASEPYELQVFDVVSDPHERDALVIAASLGGADFRMPLTQPALDRPGHQGRRSA